MALPNATAGQNPLDWAYGLFLCRGDVFTAACSDCVAAGKQDILQRCPNQQVSAIWYNQCVLQYSNRSIFSAMKQSPNRSFYSSGNVTTPTRFIQLLGETMNDVATRASDGVSGKKVAMAEVKITSLQKLYGLAQCTPDLTVSDCRSCLQFLMANLPQGKQGWISLTPSCNMGYELHPFYDTAAQGAPMPPPPDAVTGPTDRGRGF
ncbi:hypothetical protein EUGRSUZ_E03022 [Eucalyptus grandis]|uniref:Uncharacterized protein n=2 Tax=Eucalyptus grandis TaxID=71139 RepID=A0ACC3L0Q2_EUCGR|nr:hypothetical protein EUGRSUZ_E03022 [Eucalyptus grandis]